MAKQRILRVKDIYRRLHWRNWVLYAKRQYEVNLRTCDTDTIDPFKNANRRTGRTTYLVAEAIARWTVAASVGENKSLVFKSFDKQMAEHMRSSAWGICAALDLQPKEFLLYYKAGMKGKKKSSYILCEDHPLY